jgi:hypothetical protein
MSSSEDEAINAINQSLKDQLEGVDVDQIINFKLKRLDREYNQTLAAVIPEQEIPDPGWQADFSQTYQECPSSEEEEEPTEELPKNTVRDFPMPADQVTKIKEIMSKIQIKTPFWARNIPDSSFSEMLRGRIFNK